MRVLWRHRRLYLIAEEQRGKILKNMPERIIKDLTDIIIMIELQNGTLSD